MTPKALWIVCLVLGALVVITSIWISACFLRLGGQRDLRSRLLATSTTLWIIVYGVAIYFSSRPPPGVLYAVSILFLASSILQWGAVRAHGKQPPAFAFVEKAPVSFVRSGPYALIRHPLYTAYLLALVGGALLAADYWCWLLVSVPWLGYFYYTAAAGEERSFRDSPFAQEYEAYRAGTGMFLPKPWLLLRGRP
jgi:protein-S-isoprenylcysteine O-methyltransferase Ste14